MKKYWFCIIGPVEEEELRKYSGADSLLRIPVRELFNKVFEEDEVCSSGWGITEENYLKIRKIITAIISGVEMNITCTACNGSGYYDHNGSPRCGACNGTGKEIY